MASIKLAGECNNVPPFGGGSVRLYLRSALGSCQRWRNKPVKLRANYLPSSYSPLEIPFNPPPPYPSSCQLQGLLAEWESWKICAVLPVLPAFQPPGSPEALHRIGGNTESTRNQASIAKPRPISTDRQSSIPSNGLVPPRSFSLLRRNAPSNFDPSGSPAEHERSTCGKVPWLTGAQGPDITVLLAPMRRRPPPLLRCSTSDMRLGGPGVLHNHRAPFPSSMPKHPSFLPCLSATYRNRAQITSVPPSSSSSSSNASQSRG
ncbi:hypothetical protein LZ31DRAFT_389092 [Colletotrichum somersetense]|nr:hypothetical protein LZ31DRAFT_389092 [Colletotrichum somersetense]